MWPSGGAQRPKPAFSILIQSRLRFLLEAPAHEPVGPLLLPIAGFLRADTCAQGKLLSLPLFFAGNSY
jgi:hypothetical protein